MPAVMPVSLEHLPQCGLLDGLASSTCPLGSDQTNRCRRSYRAISATSN